MEKPSDTAAHSGAPDRHRSTLQKVIESGFCVITWTALGLYLEIYGPTLIDLKIKLNSNYEDVISGVAGRSMGMFPGCVLGGILVDRFGGYCHLMVAISLILAGAVTAPVPLVSSVDYLWPLTFIGGAAESVINVAGQRIILNIWKEKSAAPMILMHGGYGIGSLLVPLYANPFLAVEKPKDAINRTVSSDSTSMNFSAAPDSFEPIEYIEESRIQYTYMISAIPVILLSLAFFVYQVKEIKYNRSRKHALASNFLETSEILPKTSNDHSQRSIREMIDPATCAGGRRFYSLQIWVLSLLYFANAGGGERLIAGFVRTYSVDQLGFEKSDASFINTTFWISFLIGRISFFVLARWVSVKILILVETGAVLVISILLNVFAVNSTTAYWALVQPLGFFLAPMWPTGVSWTDFHIELTGLGMMIILLGGAVGGTCHLKLIGYLYEHKGTQMFLYQIAGYAGLAFTLAVILDIVGAQHGSRFKTIKEDEIELNSKRTFSLKKLKQ